METLKKNKTTSTSKAVGATTQPALQSVTGWYPVLDSNLVSALSSPASYSAYLAELNYLGQAIQNLASTDNWYLVTNTDDLVVYTVTDQVGTFTLTGTPATSSSLTGYKLPGGGDVTNDDTAPNYLFEVQFLGTATSVSHKTAMGLYVAAGSVGTLLSIAALVVKFWPNLISGIGEEVSADAGNAVADAAEVAAEGVAEDAAEEAGITLAGALGVIGGVAAAVLGLAATVIIMSEKDFQLRLSIVNQSSRNYLIIPNYYTQYGTITGAAASCAYLSGGTEELPPTICSNGSLWPFSPQAQIFPNGTTTQASEYTVVWEIDGLAAPGAMLQLIECDYAPPVSGSTYGTLTPSSSDTGWTGLVLNTHYYTDHAPNIALFTAGADIGQAESWYKQYYAVTPASTGSYTAQTTNLNWVLAQGDPTPDPNAGNATTWHVCVTITDIS